ncbi:LOW QUALITY PROTEIN: Helitron helicase-like protein [Phytophthora palmivora]|uniref:Helitron helicase-like protein n=1 Tax=Phytophthora palmivora TaxID=4796 RepID=A0A2P4X950_9STRA|nr:LOW QUALITY PROTEIN: Helitron helicase-like protein [Phytophthora palmivora]
MTPSQLARIGAADAEKKRRARANRSESQVDQDQQQDVQCARARRALMNPREAEESQYIKLNGLSSEQQVQQRQVNTDAQRIHREDMTEEERLIARDQDATAHRATRNAMTEDEIEAERFRRHESTKNDLRTTKSLIRLSFLATAIISPDTRTIPWSTNESVSTAALGNFLMKPKEVVVGWVTVRPPCEAPAELNRLFGNPRFKQSIRAYNNVFAFTSMGSSRTRSLSVDERGSVCHLMGALLPPLNRRPMFAQVYINDPNMEARVASRMGMTDGLNPAILEKID